MKKERIGFNLLSLVIISIFFIFLLNLVSIAATCDLPGDFVGLMGDPTPDGKVDFNDLMVFATAYGSETGDPNWNALCDICGYLGDSSPDGQVNFDDLMIFATNYGTSCPPGEEVEYLEVVSAQVDLEVGGVVEVTDESSEIYGTRLVIEPMSKERTTKERGLAEIAILLNQMVLGTNKMVDKQGFLITPVGARSTILELIIGRLEISYNKDKLSNSGVAKDSSVNVYRVLCTVDPTALVPVPIPGVSWEKVPEEKITHVENMVSIEIGIGDLLYLYTLTVTNCEPPSDFGTPLPGDLVYRLSVVGVNDNWLPGHVGIYVGEKYDEASDKKYNVIEALGGLFGPNGVVRRYYPDITIFGNGPTYMGARTSVQPVSHGKRNIIVSYAEDQVGKPYALIETLFGVYLGYARGNEVKGPDSYNCVGLAEAAYEYEPPEVGPVGIDIVSEDDEGNDPEDFYQDAILSPQEQLFRTVPASGIIDQNTAPVISSLELIPENPELGTQVTITCHATDQNQDILTYKWTIKDGNGDIMDKFIKGEQIDFQVPSVADNYEITCRVIDNYGGEDSDTKTINLGSVVEFEDYNLEQVIRETINKPEGPLYLSDVIGITTLDADNRGIISLEGIQHFQNLQQLYLGRNQVSDISALANLTNLQILYFHYNQVSDISALANLTNLTDLVFGDNQVSDISALENLTNLHQLWFYYNQVSDIFALRNLTNLTKLIFHYNQVSDISVLSNLTNLHLLCFDSNQVSDISVLSNLTNLETLLFHSNQVSDISVLSNLTNLQGLDFHSNQVSDISVLSSLTNLQSLDFHINQVSDISVLQNLTNLQSLNFHSNQVSDISVLSSLTNLETLLFYNNQVSDISALENLTNLHQLWFYYNQVSDIFALRNLTNLKDLSFDHNQVSDISVLESLTNLHLLCFDSNQVTDISALVKNEGFGPDDFIDMRYNYLDLTEGSQNMQDIETLISRGVNVHY